MKFRTRASLAWISPCLAIACSAASPPPVTAPAIRPSTHVVAVAPTVDLSEVPAPARLEAVFRFSAPAALAEHFGRLAGIGNEARALLESGVREMLESESLASIADLSVPADVALVRLNDSGRADDIVVSFGAPAMDLVERAVGQTHRMSDQGNGIVDLEPLRSGATPSLACSVAPSAAGGHRLLCSAGGRGLINAALPYLTRTITRRPPPAAGMSAEIDAPTLRRTIGSEALNDLDRARADSLNMIGRVDPGLRAALSALVPDFYDAARSAVNDATSVRSEIRLLSDRVIWHNELTLANSSASLLQLAANAMNRQQGPSPDLLATAAPDGYAYAAGTLDLRAFLPLINRTRDALNTAIGQQRGITPADATAARDALTALTQLDTYTVATAVGFDANGAMWATGTARAATAQPAQLVSLVRSWITAMRRPNLARWLRRAATTATPNAQFPDMSRARELAVTGLPTGSYGFVMPSIVAAMSSFFGGGSSTTTTMPASAARPAQAGRRLRTPGTAAPALAPPMQVLFVPDGSDVHMVLSTDARAAFQRYQSNHPPSVVTRARTANSGAAALAIVPAGLPNAIRVGDPQGSAMMQQLLGGLPDRGRTPVVVTTGGSMEAGTQRFTVDLEVQSATLRMVGLGLQLFMRMRGP